MIGAFDRESNGDMKNLSIYLVSVLGELSWHQRGDCLFTASISFCCAVGDGSQVDSDAPVDIRRGRPLLALSAMEYGTVKNAVF